MRKSTKTKTKNPKAVYELVGGHVKFKISNARLEHLLMFKYLIEIKIDSEMKKINDDWGGL